MSKWILRSGVIALALSSSVPSFAASWLGQNAGATRAGATGYLGIDFRNVNDDQVATLKLKDARGAEIIRVDHDGPAGKMGLREHDVVVQMNGVAIAGTEQLRRMLHDTAPGRTVALMVSRDGLQVTVTAQLADKLDIERKVWEQHLASPVATGSVNGAPGDEQSIAPSPASAGAPQISKYSKGFLGTILMTPSYTGVTLERLGPQLASFFGAPRGSGLLVKAVDVNSPAAVAGIHAGDVVLRADAKAVVNVTDWAKVVRDAKGRPVSVVVLHDRQERTLTLTPDGKKHSEFVPLIPFERAADRIELAILNTLNGL